MVSFLLIKVLDKGIPYPQLSLLLPWNICLGLWIFFLLIIPTCNFIRRDAFFLHILAFHIVLLFFVIGLLITSKSCKLLLRVLNWSLSWILIKVKVVSSHPRNFLIIELFKLLISLLLICKIFLLPYLGTPFFKDRKKNFLFGVVNNISKKLSAWEFYLQSFGGRLILIKSTLYLFLLYVIQTIKLTISTILGIKRLIYKFFWGSKEFSKKSLS